MIAVTTRSRARSLRHVAPLLLGTKLVERDLAATPACDRYVTVVAGAKEIWTLSIWRDAREMRAFVRTRAHAGIMWNQPHWLECYWGMRWRPASSHAGAWEGDDWSFPPTVDDDGDGGNATGSLPAAWMHSALGRTVPVDRRSLTGATGAVYRLNVPPWRLADAARDPRRVRRRAASDPDTVAVPLGVGTRGAVCLLVVMRSPEAATRLQALWSTSACRRIPPRPAWRAGRSSRSSAGRTSTTSTPSSCS